MIIQRIWRSLKRRWNELPRIGVQRGLPPSLFGYRWMPTETVQEYLARCGGIRSDGRDRYETIHVASVAYNPLPENVSSREELPRERGWWEFSFHDVPERTSGETFIATLPEARIVPATDSKGEFWVTVINRDQRALELREMAFRPVHAPVLRSGRKVRIKRATWILERVYHNYSHWLTAHLPKLLLLRSRNELGDLVLPPKLPSVLAESLKLYGFDPDLFATFDPSCSLDVRELTLFGTDRFRPELLRSVRDACPIPAPEEGGRRIFISRAKAARRRLVNEDELWPLLERAGFERTFPEKLGFRQQVALMRETSILLAPHGAGLTNMMFCRPGTHVVELADLSFPNPNFYAVASAMGLRYWLLPAEGVGDCHPIERDLRIRPAAVAEVLSRLV